MLQVDRPAKEANPSEIEENHLTPFGIFVGRNGTGMDIRSVNSGVERIEDKGLMISWHNKRVLDYWTQDTCNQIAGRDPSRWAPRLDRLRSGLDLMDVYPFSN